MRWLCWILLILCLGCYEEIDLDINENSLIKGVGAEIIYATNQGWKISIQEFVPPLSPNQKQQLDFVGCWLYENDVIVDSILATDEVFNFIPNEGKEYHIEMQIQGYPPIISDKAQMPKKPLIDSIQKNNDFVNIYLSEVSLRYPVYKRFFTENNAIPLPDDLPVFLENIVPGNKQIYSFDDVFGDSTLVIFYNLSKGMVKYIESHEQYFYYTDEGLADPVNVEGNLTNASGVFGFFRNSDSLYFKR